MMRDMILYSQQITHRTCDAPHRRKNIMATTIIKNFVVRDRYFVIVKNEQDFFLAIEDKYITDGKMNTTLNGLQMFANKDLNDCLDTLRRHVEIEYLEGQGFSKAEAFGKVFNIPVTAEFEKLFA